MTIYDLKLHEQIKIGTDPVISSTSYIGSSPIFVRRVPGGWIYYTSEAKIKQLDPYELSYEPINPVFVPFHNEFRHQVPGMNEFKKGEHSDCCHDTEPYMTGFQKGLKDGLQE